MFVAEERGEDLVDIVRGSREFVVKGEVHECLGGIVVYCHSSLLENGAVSCEHGGGGFGRLKGFGNLGLTCEMC